ncbi:MAG: InlB B-repeat-containing protein, partial [Acidobacteriota bacterium]|nr:InlB B-repeat-containing protein [Acidobacteriota bacterium]
MTLTAAPASGSTFAGWSGDCGGNSQTASVTMAAGRSCTATFDVEQQQTATLNVTVAGDGVGTVTSSPSGISCPSGCSASYDTGTEVTLTAAPASGSTFAGWSGDCGGNSQTASVTLAAGRSCTATFDVEQQQTATLNVTVAGDGVGTVTSSPSGISCSSPGCSASYDTGTEVTLTAAPASGSTFAGWSGDDCDGSSQT